MRNGELKSAGYEASWRVDGGIRDQGHFMSTYCFGLNLHDLHVGEERSVDVEVDHGQQVVSGYSPEVLPVGLYDAHLDVLEAGEDLAGIFGQRLFAWLVEKGVRLKRGYLLLDGCTSNSMIVCGQGVGLLRRR